MVKYSFVDGIKVNSHFGIHSIRTFTSMANLIFIQKTNYNWKNIWDEKRNEKQRY